MKMFTASLPMPPSANNLFATFNGRRIITREYKAWRADAGLRLLTAWRQQGSPVFDRHVQLTIALGLNYRGDISNRVKALEDALCEAIPGFPNDRWIDRLEVERVPEIDGARITVQQLAHPDERRGEAVPIGDLVRPIMADIAERVERAA